MIKRILFVYGVSFLILSSKLTYAEEKIPAFPGAEGAGAYTQGGRGGKILFVTNLNDFDPEKEDPIPGTLRSACEIKGPRIVVFRVSGTIPLKTGLSITEPYITIAGQSAPGMGICLKNYKLKISTEEVIIRYLRVRPADNMENKEGFRGDDIDAISITRSRNLIIDHCSASWSVDESLSVTYSDNVTVQWCIISESLNCSVHHKGCHGYGSLIQGKNGAHYTYHHNLYAHHSDRNPRPSGLLSPDEDPEGWIFDFRNNVIYNWGNVGAGYNTDGVTTKFPSITKMNFIGNYYISGPDSKGDKAFREKCINSRAYFEDNWMNGTCPEDQWSLVIFGNKLTEEQKESHKKSIPFLTAPVTTDDAETAFRKLIADAGATLPQRDAVDTRVINHLINKLSGSGDTGKIIDDEDEVGGWPELKSIPAPEDKDQDGIPDSWETKHGLNPEESSDTVGDKDKDGYTNIEEFLNGTDPNIKDVY